MTSPADLMPARFALEQGRKDEARTILMGIVRTDLDNGEAWHLLGQAVDDPAQKAECERRAAAAGYPPPPPPPDELKTFFQSLPPAPPVPNSIPAPTDSPPPTVARPRPATPARRSSPMLLVGIVALLLAAGGGAWWFLRQPATPGSGESAVASATATPDDAAACREPAAAYVKEAADLFEQWQEQVTLTGTTPRMALAAQIAELQTLRRDARNLEPPACAEPWHERLIVAMDDTVQSYLEFAAQADEDKITLRLLLAKRYESEYAAGLAYLKKIGAGQTAKAPKLEEVRRNPTVAEVKAFYTERGYEFKGSRGDQVATNKPLDIRLTTGPDGRLGSLIYNLQPDALEEAIPEIQVYFPEWAAAKSWLTSNSKLVGDRGSRDTDFGRVIVSMFRLDSGSLIISLYFL